MRNSKFVVRNYSQTIRNSALCTLHSEFHTQKSGPRSCCSRADINSVDSNPPWRWAQAAARLWLAAGQNWSLRLVSRQRLLRFREALIYLSYSWCLRTGTIADGQCLRMANIAQCGNCPLNRSCNGGRILTLPPQTPGPTPLYSPSHAPPVFAALRCDEPRGRRNGYTRTFYPGRRSQTRFALGYSYESPLGTSEGRASRGKSE